MPEEVLFKTEAMRTRADVAQYLRTVADRLDDGDSLTLTAGNDSVTMDPPERVEFEVKAERETNTGASEGELSIEFELEWDERQSGGAGDTGDLSIE